jgi:hypothetical protein
MTHLHEGTVLSRARGRWLAIVGISAPIAFTVSAVAHSRARDDHALLSDPVSALAAGPSGVLQDLTFAMTGLSMVAFGVGLHLALRPSRRVDQGPSVLALFGLGMIGAALWPAVDAAGGFTESRLPHVIAGFVTFASAWLAALLLAPQLARDPGWNGLSRYVRAAGVALLMLFIMGGILVRPSSGPFHDWLGLFQWLYLGIWFACVTVLAVRLFSSSTEDGSLRARRHSGE